MKVQLFAVLDAAKDVQLKIESAQYRLSNNAGKINRYIGKKALWTYQHKYGARTGSNCEEDRAVVEGEVKKLTAAYEQFLRHNLNSLFKNTQHTLSTELHTV
jgi:hypothetical protein